MRIFVNNRICGIQAINYIIRRFIILALHVKCWLVQILASFILKSFIMAMVQLHMRKHVNTASLP
jgi:hypothetical protein